MVDQNLSAFFPDIIKNDGIVSHVAIPPLVGQLNISTWIVLMSLPCLPSTSCTVKPKTGLWLSATRYSHVHTCHLLDGKNMPQSDVSRDVL